MDSGFLGGVTSNTGTYRSSTIKQQEERELYYETDEHSRPTVSIKTATDSE